MSTTGSNSLPPNEMSEEVASERLRAMENRIRECREAEKAARRRHVHIFTQCLSIRCQLSYLSVARFLRTTVAPFLGWRWAVVLVGTTAVGGVFLAISLSWVGGLSGIVIGAALFTSLLGLPSDSRLAQGASALIGSLAELELRRNEERGRLLGIRREIGVATEDQRRMVGQFEQYRHSRLHHLRTLAARNWKAMRGGELEAFLEEVFCALQYAVERTGGAGDQGVDLIVGKDGHRIAVQVKGYLDSVPNTAVQEAFTGMAFYKCDACAVITNSRFTLGGKNIAKRVGCALIDEAALPKLVMGQIDLWSEVSSVRAQTQSDLPAER